MATQRLWQAAVRVRNHRQKAPPQADTSRLTVAASLLVTQNNKRN